MIRGHIALVRLLQNYMEGSGLPWSAVQFHYDRDEDGRVVLDDRCAEMSFSYRGRDCDIVIFAPNDEHGEGGLPLGKLAARCNGRVVKGPIDRATWDAIAAMIKSTTEDAHA